MIVDRTARHRAQELATKAEHERRLGNFSLAEQLYAEAADAEEQALAGVPNDKVRTLGILAVSLVALRYKAQQLALAERSAHEYLAVTQLHPRARMQLRELLQAIWSAEDQEAAGRSTPRARAPVEDNEDVRRYKRITRDLLVRRALGLLSHEDGAEVSDTLDGIWSGLSDDDRDEIDAWLETERRPAPDSGDHDTIIGVESDDLSRSPRSAA